MGAPPHPVAAGGWGESRRRTENLGKSWLKKKNRLPGRQALPLLRSCGKGQGSFFQVGSGIMLTKAVITAAINLGN